MSRLPPPLPALRALVEADQRPLTGAALAMAEAIRARHGDAVRALIFYGSALREGEAAAKMLDFYVIVGSYRAVHGTGLRAFATWILPPSVHFLQIDGPEGRKLRSKYAIISERAFHRRAGGGVLESMLWARFTQPATVQCDDPATRAALLDTLARAPAHFARQTRPLLDGRIGPGDLWVRGLAESYRTELRPERPLPRATEIVERAPDRYARLSDILLERDAAGHLCLPDPGRAARLACKARWLARRVAGKPLGALRVLKAATTFDAGLDYILEKIESHSGVRMEPTEAERRHPVLNAPRLAWRLWRAGAFR
ncbi:hypothetical protein DDZ14_02365 [Maritimibacter sp. 55A14]|uniref:hypothetical protein n=1 Tax=Maritimibacter sp. 55A14 TaxID=2174844 RepID=UPI000D6199E7|nr:hypothetical protein [Maritimibacter sp. 55A14]PWE34026.1 hypothetical protein DDZ14_02365 [Maritimibacter sp. 55A14]